jgi:6-phosphogluconolactonase
MSQQVFADTEALARHAAARVATLCREAVENHGSCHLVLAGGHTPRRCYELLRAMDLPWAALHIWFGDERCLPPGDAGRNDAMADGALLAHVPIPPAQVHRIPAEQGPEAAAAAYAALLASAPAMDIVLLGMGEDGHTASLFPGNPALDDTRLAVPVHDAPKPPPVRVSMGLSVLNAAHHRLILVMGNAKAGALARVRRGDPLPAARLAEGEWLIDQDAASPPA